ncbi:AAA family ATPase [bacterium]|nr:AAA family ATPase [bacterium]
MRQPDESPQDAIIRLLCAPATYPEPGPVTHVTTHGAHVFLCGRVALKIKRAVRYDYMDLSTPDLRHAMLQRELDLNRATAPDIYRDVVPITLAPDAGLRLDGSGPPVEWVLRMNRFATEDEMTAVAASGRLTEAVAEDLGRVIQAFHSGCPTRSEPGDALIGEILDELERVLTPMQAGLDVGQLAAFLSAARQHLTAVSPALRQRSAAGHVRRVHGDLHLGNLLLIDGRPVLLDALEFDERLATCDVLYDLGFLLMDLCHLSFGRQANAVLNAYLLAAGGAEDAGLAALPLFMAVRAAIRAMVVLQTDQATGQPGHSAATARRYLTQALGHLANRKPVGLAIGGVSGTGKTALARALCTMIAPCPGAVHLRSDTERKSLTSAVSYAPAARDAIYQRMLARAARLSAAGASVILDATFLEATQRRAAEDLASRAGISFCGLWLQAPPHVLIERVSARHGDASDADPAVVQAQLAALASADPPDPRHWRSIDAGGSAEATSAAASAALSCLTGDPL